MAGCVISPRRTVVSVSPTPTPITSPTPTPGTTPTPIPTPTPMAATVPKTDTPSQSLFTAAAGSDLIAGFRVNSDGSLAPIPGSPFLTSAPIEAVTSLHGTLIVATGNTINAYQIDKETGSTQQTDSVQTSPISLLTVDASSQSAYVVTRDGMLAFDVSGGKLQELPIAVSNLHSHAAQSSQMAGLDATGRFMYVVDPVKAELQGFRVDHGKLTALSPPSYPIPRGTTFVVLLNP